MIRKQLPENTDSDLLFRVDELCNEFESSLKAGKPLRIDEVLSTLSEPEQAAALPELLWLEWSNLRALGKSFSLESYLATFPDYSELVKQSWDRDQERETNSEELVNRFLENGRYELKEIFAEGGLGRIWHARDHVLQRDVAVKIVSPHLQCYESIHERFRREAKIISNLEHPGIAPIHSAGATPSGHPYIVMRLVPGITLQQKAADMLAPFRNQDGKLRDGSSLNELYRSLEFREILGFFIFVCKVIDFAHQKSIIHRDIKPSNIIVGKFGEAAVIDWGLGKLLEGNQDQERDDCRTGSETVGVKQQDEQSTSVGEVLGTPAYMSPEQAQGQHDKVDRVSDVFSLGATLFYLLTGGSPDYQENKAGETNSKASRCLEFPAATPNPLIAICRKAMAESPNQRYQNASALANDLECWLAYKPVSVYQDPISVKAQRWIRYNPRLSAALGTIAIFTFIGLIAGSFVQRYNNKQLAVSKKETADAFAVMTKLFEGLNPSEYLKSSSEAQNIALMSMRDAGYDFSNISYNEITERVLDQLVIILSDNDKVDEAMQIVDRAISNQSEKQRRNLVYHFLKGKVLRRSGEFSEAEKVFNECLAEWIRVDDRRGVFRAQIELAQCAEQTGEFDSLQDFANKHYPEIQKVFDKESVEYRSAAMLAAQYLLHGGKPRVALEVLEQIKAPRKQGMLWLDYQLNLAEAFEANQERSRAQKVLKDVVSKLDNTADPKHRLVIQARLQLGNTLWQVRDFDEAIAVLKKCLNSFDEESANDRPYLASCNLQIAESLIGKEDFEAAVPYLEKCIDIRQQHLGDKHPETLRAISVKGRLLAYLGKYEEAEKRLSDCLKVQTEILGEHSEDVLNTKNTLAGCLANLGRLDEAIISMESLYESYERVHGENNPVTLNALSNLSFLQLSQGSYESAKKGLLRHYQGWKELSDADSEMKSEYLLACMLLANCHGELREKDEATKLFAEAVQGQLKVNGVDHPDVYTTLHYARTVLPYGCDSNTLVELHRAVLLEMEKSPKDLWEKKTQLFDGIAEVYYMNQQFREALEYLQKSREIIPTAESLQSDIRSVDSFIQNRFRIVEVAMELDELGLCESCLAENDIVLTRHPEKTVYKLRSLLWQIACAIQRKDSEKEHQLRELLQADLKDVKIAAPYGKCITEIAAKNLRK